MVITMAKGKWYKEPANVLELREFLIDSESFVDNEEVHKFLQSPEKYTEIWNLYQKEIVGPIKV